MSSRHGAAVAAAILSALAAVAAHAAAQRAEDAERALRKDGYALVSSHADDRRGWQYWWNRRRHDCLLLTLIDDRVERRDPTSETDCGQTRDDSRMSERGKIALAAARSLRVDALLHRSHERDLRRHDEVHEVAQFERGYRHGLQEQRPDPRDGGRAYADGYRAGERKRQVKPMPPTGTPPPAVASVAKPHDLAGRPAHELEPTMRALGYQRWAGFDQGRESFTTWRGANPSQCIRATVRDGRIQAMHDISEAQCQ